MDAAGIDPKKTPDSQLSGGGATRSLKAGEGLNCECDGSPIGWRFLHGRNRLARVGPQDRATAESKSFPFDAH
jgi:hypothetical protein